MKLPTLSLPLKLFAPAPAGPVPGMAGATGGHLMFASSGGGRGGDYDQDDYGFDEFEDDPHMDPDDEEPRRRPRSTRTVRAGGGATGGQTRTAQHQPEERYWTDYLRIALPVIGLLLMIGLLWFWATQLISDGPETTEPATEEVGLVSQSTPEPTEEPTDLQGDTGNQTIGIGEGVSTPETSQQAPQSQTTEEQPPAGDDDQTAEEPVEEEPATGSAFGSGDPVVVTENGVNVRPNAGVAGDPITMLSAGDELIIASGPVDADDYTWWEVILPGGDSGWVVEDFIEAAD